MKKLFILSLVCLLAMAFTVSCKPKAKQVAPPPPPQVKEQPKIEKVEQPPAVKKPEISEEELFMARSLDQINREKPLLMIHFDYNEYSIREDAKPVLEADAAWLKKFKTAKLLIEGHCDERGTEDYNLALGEKRAKSTFDYLVSLGISGDRIKTISYGKSQPLDMGNDEAAWQKNRRAQFLIIEK
ncbi:MAG: peptidoglycan-associated lipoprotein Pal [Candidatus Aminicenantes bacterium]|jgi:peptidoglycan-associated lipoprotein|nr:peptidoglycan-associated lipoprotein Pal [Candidatus Aminicenantes bacterium]